MANMDDIFCPNTVPVGTMFNYNNVHLDKVCIGEVVYNYGVGRNIFLLWDVGLHEKQRNRGDYRISPCIQYSNLICFLE